MVINQQVSKTDSSCIVFAKLIRQLSS